jgi:hypothetical protein
MLMWRSVRRNVELVHLAAVFRQRLRGRTSLDGVGGTHLPTHNIDISERIPSWSDPTFVLRLVAEAGISCWACGDNFCGVGGLLKQRISEEVRDWSSQTTKSGTSTSYVRAWGLNPDTCDRTATGSPPTHCRLVLPF